MSKQLSLLTFSIAAGLMLAAPSADAGMLKKFIKEVSRPITQTAKEIDRGAKRVAKEVDRTVERITEDAERNFENIAKETKRGVDNIGEGIAVAGEASFKLAEAGLEAQVSAVRSLAKGDLEDAAQAVSVDLLRAADDIAADAVVESSALRLVGQVAASAYGGPAGASAFAGWYGYHASGGDWDAAAKGAAITLVSSGVSYGVEMIPGDAGMTISGAARVVSSGVGSAGVVALAGGDAEAVRNGFLMGSVTAAASETYRSTTGIKMSGEVATEGPMGKDPAVPITRLNPNVSHVGLDVPKLGIPGEGILNKASYYLAQEQSPLMQGVAKVPGMNRMAYFHDRWMQTTTVSVAGWVQATIPPAMAISYVATGVPLAQHIQDDTE